MVRNVPATGVATLPTAKPHTAASATPITPTAVVAASGAFLYDIIVVAPNQTFPDFV